MNGQFTVGEDVDVLWCVGGDVAHGTVIEAYYTQDRYRVAYTVSEKLYESVFRSDEMRRVS